MIERLPRSTWLPTAALVIGIALSLSAAAALRAREHAEARAAFNRRADNVLEAVVGRLRVYEQVAAAATGLFAASDNVTRLEWHEYVRHFELDSTYPGLEALEYVEYVPRAGLERHVRMVRASGVRDYQVWPATGRDHVLPVVYGESAGGGHATLGFDLASDSIELEALERARDFGGPVLSGRIDPGPPRATGQSHVLIAAPVFRRDAEVETFAARREALTGFVVAPVGTRALFARLLTITPINVDLEVYDGPAAAPGAVLYDADSVPHALGAAPKPTFDRTASLVVGGRPWTLYLSGYERGGSTISWAPLLVLLAGLTLTAAVALGLRAQGLVGRRAVALAAGMTAELRRTQSILEADVTERRRVEAALRESEERYRDLLETIPAGVYVSVEGQFAYANRELRRILGASSSEALLGRSVLMQVAPAFREAAERVVEADSGRPTPQGELQFLRLDGSVIDVEATTRTTQFDGKPATMVKLRDITDRKRADESRQSLEAQLRQAQKMEAVGTLAGGIAHDFNNILGAIIGYTELAAADAAGNAAVEESLAQVQRAGARAGDLVRQILAFSRRDEQARRPLRLEDVIREVVPLLRSSFPAQVDIRTELADHGRTVFADAAQVHQVLMNLATNALHAMLPAGGALTLRSAVTEVEAAGGRATPGLRERRYVCVTVADTGCGIDPAVIPRIFDPFFTTKPPGQGTGLGLAVVHGIMKSHDGAVTVESRTGQGTAFHLYFPAFEADPAAEPVQAGRLPRGRGEHVLLVDDEASLARLGRRALERLGYRVTAETDPSRALEAFRANPGEFDVLVTDLTMPTMNGLELVRAVHRIRAELPVVLSTGFGGDIDAGKARAAGIRELVRKPATLAGLAAAVGRALRPERG